jgi:asparagine synthase (glutamine-hydrolysing)
MSAANTSRAPDGVDELSFRSAAGAIGRRAVTARDRSVVCELDEASELLVVGDVRLYNRREVASALGLGDEGRSDLELVRRGYGRWGADLTRRLIGDFAFAIWDGRSRKVIAARDHFGVRPLYYRHAGGKVLIGSDLRQILAATPGRLPLSSQRVLDYLLSDYPVAGRTFFEGVSLLKPGYLVTMTASASTERRYWTPPPAEQSFQSYEEACRAFADLFRLAVRDRLESDHPIVAHSSGGFDSTSILAVAREVYDAEPHRPRLATASVTVPSHESDETARIEAVERRLGFHGIRWPAAAKNDVDLRDPSLLGPGIRRGLAGGPARDLEFAREIGARVLLGGFGGDDVAYASGVFRELARRGAWRTVLTEAAMVEPRSYGFQLLRDSIRGLVPPRHVHWLRNRHPARSRTPPSWLGPALRPIYPGEPDQLYDPPDFPWSTHLQRGVWRQLTNPRVGELVDVRRGYASQGEVELRFPYLDVRLAELVVGIPAELRLPHGNMRRLQRDALEGIMPVEVLARRTRGSFGSIWSENARRILPEVSEIIEEGDWLTAPYVDRRVARRMLRAVSARVITDGDQDWRVLRQVVDFAVFEAWTRRVSSYYSSREGFDV